MRQPAPSVPRGSGYRSRVWVGYLGETERERAKQFFTQIQTVAGREGVADTLGPGSRALMEPQPTLPP